MCYQPGTQIGDLLRRELHPITGHLRLSCGTHVGRDLMRDLIEYFEHRPCASGCNQPLPPVTRQRRTLRIAFLTHDGRERAGCCDESMSGRRVADTQPVSEKVPHIAVPERARQIAIRRLHHQPISHRRSVRRANRSATAAASTTPASESCDTSQPANSSITDANRDNASATRASADPTTAEPKPAASNPAASNNEGAQSLLESSGWPSGPS